MKTKLLFTCAVGIFGCMDSYLLGHGPRGSTKPPRADSSGPIFFCSLDPSKHEKLMPPSPNWDELPI